MYWNSYSWCSSAVKCGFVLFTFLINNGACKEKKSLDYTSPGAIDRHSHSVKDVWTSIDRTILPWDELNQQMPNIVPLTLEEQTLRQTKSRKISNNYDNSISKDNKIKKSSSRSEGGTSSKNSKSEDSKKQKGKSGSYDSSGNNRNRNYDYEEGETNTQEEEREPPNPFEGYEVYPTAKMDFEIFELEFFIQPRFKKPNPDVWMDIN